MNQNCDDRSGVRHAAWVSFATLLPVSMTGCDPIVNIYGSFFPAWIICIALGVLVTVLLRLVFVAIKIDGHLGPRILIYPALTFLAAALSWLLLFGP